MPSRVPLLDTAACDRIYQRVLELEGHWIARHGELPSFTLGATAYLDVPRGGMHDYRINRSRGNRILIRHFNDLYASLTEVLSPALGRPAWLSDRLALPGFHIYRYHPDLVRLEPSV